jgi:site-specific recombinase XerD
MTDPKTDSTKKEFIKYLDSLGLSAVSHKNYRSDLGYFISWAILKIRSLGAYVENLTEIIPFLNEGIGREFKNYMAENKVPAKTINRRLSTIRHLSKFLLENNINTHNFTKDIENISVRHKKKAEVNPVFSGYKAYLENEKVSPNTIKNYLSDIRHFLTWLETNQQSGNLID